VKTIRGMVVLGGFLLLTLPLMPVQALFVMAWPKMARRFPHWYHTVLARLMGLKVEVHGKVPEPGACLLVANHVSWLDIVVLSAVLPVSFIAKREVRGWPLFGQMAQLQRTVFVDRDRRVKAALQRDDISERLNQGDALVLFPEGTSHDGRRVLPFKTSLFGVVTAHASAPAVPVAIAYTHHRGLPITARQRPSCAWYGDMDLAPHLWAFVKSGPVKVTVAFHPPLDDTADRKTLARDAEATIRTSLAAILTGSHRASRDGQNPVAGGS
jgi:lyso-ornithine lipid O-acyltransferase